MTRQPESILVHYRASIQLRFSEWSGKFKAWDPDYQCQYQIEGKSIHDQE